MDNFALFLSFLWFLFFLFTAFYFYRFFKYRKELKKLKNRPLEKKYRQYIQDIPLYKNLPEKYKKTMDYKIQRFFIEKDFIAPYIKLTDEIKTLTAFYGCILTAAYEEFCYPNLKYVYIYPKAIKKNIKREYIVEEDVIISGEALQDSVIISWHDAKYQIKHNKKRNVIIHEFAHMLDFADGAADGVPPMTKEMFKEWKKTVLREYKLLLEKKQHHSKIEIDEYALTNEAEFFAVMTEYFFCNPKFLHYHFPDIYEELKKFYRLDTLIILEE